VERYAMLKAVYQSMLFVDFPFNEADKFFDVVAWLEPIVEVGKFECYFFGITRVVCKYYRRIIILRDRIG